MKTVWDKQWVFGGTWVGLWAVLWVCGQCCVPVALLAVACASLFLTDILFKAYDEFLYERQTLKDVVKKAVLITGCDTGFGNKLSKRLSKIGFKVYAGCLQPQGEGAKQLSAVDGVTILPMDVSKQEDIQNAFTTVSKDLKKNGLELWAVVNNAGIATVGLVEMLPMEAYRRNLEINTFAPVLVTKTFLPLLRAANRGRVVNIASQAGRFTPYSFTPYTMSKHALVAFSDGLRLEMRQWNISVHTVEPGLYKTDISNPDNVKPRLQKQLDEAGEEVREAYGQAYIDSLAESSIRAVEKGRPACKVYEVVDDMVDAVAGVKPKIQYIPSTHVKVWSRVLREMPFEIIDAFWLMSAPTAKPAAAK